ncbi:MAG TPA: THUMP domain-containing protein [Rhodocyclaceae bacterium]|nr:THUMP domain-containing protein [Rhodocyclaceae bacterium]
MDKFFAPCPRGLEALLADDLKDYGARKIDVVPGGVAFEGTWETCYRANLESRIATRILWRLGSAPYRSEAEIYRLAYDMPWSHLFSPDQTLRVYVTAQRSHLKSLEYITLKVKDAVCDRFRADGGSRPSIDTKNPDVRIHLFLTDRDATLYVDTSGEPLYQRGHKIAKVEAPLKENLAAGILRLAGWKPGVPLFDPMCGSGTFLLEAVQMSLGDAPGLARDAGGFGFQRLKNFDGALWKRLRIEAAEQRISIGELPIWGSDISADAVARARQNLAHAGYDDLVRLGQADLLDVSPPVPEGILVANPPYGERLSDDDALAEFYPRLGDALKARFSGWTCWFLTADPRLAKLIGLKPKRKTPIFNGNLECRLYSFPMVSGTAREL